ncbi:Multi antimicrobial extrusion protein [Kalmanozyma brasiliensis GHG001]|uniref:Drugsodium antiporter n=1 Tax=Kalmanozyma brasiliensis (strain GHG001) TaxID=1365824 RepID=V5EA41_KALBG|nr:Multi antimicrobial extrusion protein [Kalmanozyma brasiliensis GHG001]EST07236.1 Multi antimicrobial extrusion protein [Kalmanozyma brasiliensis GHG001]
MSFTPRYGSSVTRDYTLLQGHPSTYQHFGALATSQPRGAANQHADHHDQNALGDNSLDDNDASTSASTSSIHVDDATDNGLSNISLPPNHAAVPNSPAFGRSNRLAITPITSSRNRRPSVNAYTQIAGIPSEYLLGGTAVPPPTHNPGTASNISLGAPAPADATHNTSQKPARASQEAGAERRSEELDANEATSLLGRRTSDTHPPQAPGAASSSYGAVRRPSFDGASILSTGGPGVSGWAAANLIREAPLPGVEQVASIAREPHDNIAWREARVLTGYTIPIFATHLLELSLSVASVFSLGHLGTVELAAASLSSMTANVSGFSVLSGFISALDTLLPSAYTQQPKSVGLWTQRMGVILAAILPLIFAVWLNAEAILVRIGQDPQVAYLAGRYLAVLSIGLPGYALFEVCRRYLQAQGLMHAPTIVLMFVSPLNAIANYLLVWGPESIRLGFIGAPLASALSMWLMAILCFFQCVLGPRDAWDGFTRAAFKWEGIKPVLSLGFAGMVSLAAEWWAWEIVGLVTSQLGVVALAAQSVLLVSSSITYQLPFGASVAAAVRIGNLLGANRPDEAKISSRVSLILSLAMGGLNSALFLIFRKQWGWLFSSDVEVIQLVEHILPLLAFFQVADGICGICGGVLRGTGRQAAGAGINMISYYIIGIPIGLVLTFTRINLGLAGLWWGLTIALLFGSAGMFWLISITDWEWEVKKVQLRMAVDDPSAAGAATHDAAKPDVECATGPRLAQTTSAVDAINSGDAAAFSPLGLVASSIAGSVIDEEEEEDLSI